MAVDLLQFIHPWYEYKEFGGVMAAMRETSRFGEGPMAQSFDHVRSIKNPNLKYVRKSLSHTQSQWWSRRLARAQFRVNHLTQHQASLRHQPAKMTQRSVANRSKQVHQSQHNRGLKGQTNLGRIVCGSTNKIHGIKQTITFRGGRVPGSSPPQPIFSNCRFGSACSADGEMKPPAC